MRGRVLLVRVVAEPGRDIPLELARGLPLRMTTPPRSDLERVPPDPPEIMPTEAEPPMLYPPEAIAERGVAGMV